MLGVFFSFSYPIMGIKLFIWENYKHHKIQLNPY